MGSVVRLPQRFELRGRVRADAGTRSSSNRQQEGQKRDARHVPNAGTGGLAATSGSIVGPGDAADGNGPRETNRGDVTIGADVR